MTATAFATDEGPERPRSPHDFTDDLAALAWAQTVEPRPNLDGWDGRHRVEECVRPAFSAAPFQVEVN